MDYKNTVVLDIECYKNYLLVMFKNVSSGKIIYFEKFNNSEINRRNILHILNKYTIVTFNGIKYDLVILEILIAGFSNEAIYKASGMLIIEGKQPWQVRKQLGVAALYLDHVDLIEVAPLSASLKLYGGRIHCPKMQDLPIEPDDTIDKSDLGGMRLYCGNDLDLTIILLKALEKQLDLRYQMSDEYNTDMKSKSDAQIAEAVIKYEMKKNYNLTLKRPKIETGTQILFKAPKNLVFQTKVLQDLFQLFKSSPATVDKSGHVKFKTGEYKKDDNGIVILNKAGNPTEIPHELSNKKINIGTTTYKIGIGGLHSCEKGTSHVKGKYLYKDYDVEAFYPRIILNNKLAPTHIGDPFLVTYESIVNRRLKAKREGNKVVNESLKITINGSFGKLGSKWSVLYAPHLMMQVTLTGQLSLLMLIESLELAGLSVVSGNTDGIVIKMLPEEQDLVDEIVSDWEFNTDYGMESNSYLGLYSRDVNNYIAITEKGVKAKGAYADPRETANILKKNPTNEICPEAVKLFLKNNIPIRKTILECKDVSKFVTIRTVKGGALKEGQLVGKAVRWYYGKYELDAMYYKTSGNKVPRSDGAVPIMDLPNKLPDDIDYNWYIEESEKMLKEIGYKKVIK